MKKTEIKPSSVKVGDQVQIVVPGDKFGDHFREITELNRMAGRHTRVTCVNCDGWLLVEGGDGWYLPPSAVEVLR
jgi:hypothetical protein